MARRRGYGYYGGGHGGGAAEEWVDRWRDGVDTDIAQLQRDYISAAQTMVEVRQWIINHDKSHATENQSRAAIPGNVRDWILFALTVVTILLALGVIQPGG